MEHSSDGSSLSLTGPAAVVAVEMWEPALYAGFQAPRSRLRHSRLGNATGRPARHFHSEAEDFAHFHPKTAIDHYARPKTAFFRKPRRSRTFTDSCAEPISARSWRRDVVNPTLATASIITGFHFWQSRRVLKGFQCRLAL